MATSATETLKRRRVLSTKLRQTWRLSLREAAWGMWKVSLADFVCMGGSSGVGGFDWSVAEFGRDGKGWSWIYVLIYLSNVGII